MSPPLSLLWVCHLPPRQRPSTRGGGANALEDCTPSLLKGSSRAESDPMVLEEARDPPAQAY